MFGLSTVHLAAIGIAALLIFGAGTYAGYHWEALEVAQLEAKYAKDKLAAEEAARTEQKALDEDAVQATRADLEKQASIVATTKSQLAQVQKNVKSLSRNCVSNGVLRLYNGAILGVSPDRVPNDPGGDAARPAGIDAATLGSSFVTNLGNCRQNTERLRSLIGLLRQYQAAAKRP